MTTYPEMIEGLLKKQFCWLVRRFVYKLDDYEKLQLETDKLKKLKEALNGHRIH
jgi:hypothetical protein